MSIFERFIAAVFAGILLFIGLMGGSAFLLDEESGFIVTLASIIMSVVSNIVPLYVVTQIIDKANRPKLKIVAGIVLLLFEFLWLSYMFIEVGISFELLESILEGFSKGVAAMIMASIIWVLSLVELFIVVKNLIEDN